MGPFFQVLTKGTPTPQECANACASWEPSDPVKGPYCRSWTFATASKGCSLSEKAGCTVYTVNPKKQCVLWEADKTHTSGWVAVPLQ